MIFVNFFLFFKNNFTRINNCKFIHHKSQLKPFLSYLPCIVRREYFSIIFNVLKCALYPIKYCNIVIWPTWTLTITRAAGNYKGWIILTDKLTASYKWNKIYQTGPAFWVKISKWMKISISVKNKTAQSNQLKRLRKSKLSKNVLHKSWWECIDCSLAQPTCLVSVVLLWCHLPLHCGSTIRCYKDEFYSTLQVLLEWLIHLDTSLFSLCSVFMHVCMAKSAGLWEFS
jgi:hypothetical protein